MASLYSFKSFFLFVIFFTISTSAKSEELRYAVHGDHYDLYREGKTLSLRALVVGDTYGESLEHVVEQAATIIRDYSRHSRKEACASFCFSERTQQFSARILTVNSHIACPVIHVCSNDDFRPLETQVDIHSHGSSGRFRYNFADDWLTDEGANGWSTGGKNLFRFSSEDRLGPPGYLVTPNGVEFQEGQNGFEAPILFALEHRGTVCR